MVRSNDLFTKTTASKSLNDLGHGVKRMRTSEREKLVNAEDEEPEQKKAAARKAAKTLKAKKREARNEEQEDVHKTRASAAARMGGRSKQTRAELQALGDE